MTNEQWQTAWRVVNAAREIPPVERRPFVQSETADPEILQRVFELLEESPQSDEPVREAVRREGMQVGRYLVEGLVGRGGMGEVYAAQDLDLERRVALKFLLPHDVGDPSALKRFIREAKAASALNHPNILTIYEVIESSTGLAIAMELVEGKPLSQLRPDAFPIPQVVELGRQVASALAAAHEHGIAHRDIKPQNLMVRPDGFIKVLDFGLAQGFTGKDSRQWQDSITGMPGGTLRYMSPEQLRDEPITGASDVFSLGIVLSERVAGRHPFDSAHAWETAHAIHTRDAAPPSSINPAVPLWLDDLIVSMLTRDPAQRPTAKQVAEQLTRTGAGMNGGAGAARPGPRRRVIAALVGGAALALAGVVLRLKTRTTESGEAALRVVPLTGTDGVELWPTFSPDGKQILYARESSDGKADLYIKLIGGGPPLRLPTRETANLDPAWSPDGLQIAFFRQYPKHLAVMTMGALGGTERLVGSVFDPAQVERGLTWRPDQKALIVRDRARPGTTDVSLWALPLDGGGPQILTSPPSRYSDFAPAFSPDGKTLAFLRKSGDTGEIFVMERPGQEHRLTLDGQNIDSLCWAADGNSILFTLRRSTGRALWRVSKSGGAPQRVSETAVSPFNISIAARGDRFAYAQILPRRADIWKLSIGNTRKEPVKLVTSAGFDMDPSYSPDGERIAFASTRSGHAEIWVVGSDGSNPYQVTSFGQLQAGSPRWSPDGKHIAFDHALEDTGAVFVVSSTGGSPRVVVRDASLPGWSSDGQWIYFTSRRSGTDELWRVPAAGGGEEQITRNGGVECIGSPDGRFVYYKKDHSMPGIWRIPAAGGEEVRAVELGPSLNDRYWDAAANSIYFLDTGNGTAADSKQVPVLKRFLHETGRVEPVATLDQPLIRNYRGLSVSPDGRTVLWVLARRISQIMLVEGFR